MKLAQSLVVAQQSATPSAAPTGTPATADDRSTTFRAVEGGNQMQSGERLLVEAYAAFWLILFYLLVIMWRRQRRLDERIRGLETSLQKARGSKSEG